MLKVADEQDRLHQLKLHMPIQANSSLVLLKSVLEDQGVAYLPTYLIGDHIQKEEITPLMLDGTITCETHALYALYFPSKYSNPKVRSFIDFLVAELGLTRTGQLDRSKLCSSENGRRSTFFARSPVWLYP